jgi:hypothetical protein
LRVVNRIEADIQQLAVQLAEIKQSIVAMVEMEPELSAEQHGSCDTCYGDIRLCETYNQTHPPGTVRRDKKRGT